MIKLYSLIVTKNILFMPSILVGCLIIFLYDNRIIGFINSLGMIFLFFAYEQVVDFLILRRTTSLRIVFERWLQSSTTYLHENPVFNNNWFLENWCWCFLIWYKLRGKPRIWYSSFKRYAHPEFTLVLWLKLVDLCIFTSNISVLIKHKFLYL